MLHRASTTFTAFCVIQSIAMHTWETASGAELSAEEQTKAFISAKKIFEALI